MPDDLMGGTFTITNLGGIANAYGFATPIINQPQSAILGTGPITERAVVRDGEIVIRPPVDLLNNLKPHQPAALCLPLSGLLQSGKQGFPGPPDQALVGPSRFVPRHLRAL